MDICFYPNFQIIYYILTGMSVDTSGSYDSAIYASMGIYVVSIFLYTSVVLYQKIFAKDRYIMADYKKIKQEIKDENEKERMLWEKQEILERTFQPQDEPTIMPQYVLYQKISTV